MQDCELLSIMEILNSGMTISSVVSNGQETIGNAKRGYSRVVNHIVILMSSHI